MIKEDSLKKRYSIKLLSNIIQGLIGIILIAIVPKALGPIAYGQFIYLRDFFIKIIGFLDMGSSIAFFTKLSAKNSRKELINFYFIYSLIILFFIVFIIWIIKYFDYIYFLLPDIPKEYIFIALFFSFFTWFSQIFIKISDAYALTVSVELIKIGHKILSLVLLLYFIYFTIFDLDRYYYFQYISIISFLIILTFLFIKKNIFKNILNYKLSIIKLLKEFIDYCQPLFIYSIIGLIVGFFDIWLLQKMAGSEQTGFYGLAYSIASMCFLFTSAMTPLITREFAKLYKEKKILQMRKIFYRYVPMLYSISAFFGVFISFQSENILIIFTDERFKDAFLVLFIMALYPLPQTYGQLSGSIFYATEQTKLYRDIGIINMLIGIFISYLFIYIFNLGAMGLGLKMLLSGVIGINIQLYFNARFLKFDIKYFLYHQLYSIIFFVVLAFLSSYLINFNSAILNLLMSGVIYTILVIIFTFVFPQVFALTRIEINNNSYRIWNDIKRKIKKQ